MLSGSSNDLVLVCLSHSSKSSRSCYENGSDGTLTL